MRFTVDTDKKIIFGWSAKCGCSKIKNIFWFLKTGKIRNPIHTKRDMNQLPGDIEEYITILFCRNPYLRLISGFLDKYKENGQYRFKWIYPTLTFKDFVDELIKDNWKLVEKHHFCPQTDEMFKKDIILKSKKIKVYDISNIDYKFIEDLYDKKLPKILLNRNYGHERKFFIKNTELWDKDVFNLPIEEYIDYNIDPKYFFNQEILDKIDNYFKSDFDFFREFGIEYKSPLEN